MTFAIKRILQALTLLLLGACQCLTPVFADTGAVQRDHIEVELIAETTSVQPGAPLRVGLRLLPDPGWHTYWRNPGDSGIPTEIDWDLPPGVSASPIAWPYPGAMPMGHLINYGYKGEHLLPVTLEVPADLAVGDDFVIRAEASWLVCEEICIPGDAELALSLPVANDSPGLDLANEELFAWADQRRPEPVDWPARFSVEGGQLSLQIESQDPGHDTEWAFFSALANVVDHSVPASTTAGDERILVAQKLSPFIAGTPDTLPFVLVDTVNERAFELTARIGDLTSTGELAPTAPPVGWMTALGLALLGGLMLNLMPCVFPVLSIKAISLVDGAGTDQRAHGLAYTAGVVLSFAVLAALLLGLRSAGEAIGWGFQLQSPWIVGVLIYVLFSLGLSLSGLFDFGSGLMNTGQNLTERSGLSGS
ncbi:MAG: protein-disulfide reductase DsbD domain-containing protein, partial [Wenzhouxiangella sp.]|nr:protein-disulfide reductase DsbD domain-containing protein [Wenzhouxiangella sp.]